MENDEGKIIMEETQRERVMNGIIEPTDQELRIPNIFDIQEELKAIAGISGGLSGAMNAINTRANDPRYNAEFEEFFEKSETLRQVGRKHSWTRATVSAVARATVGAGFSFARHPIYGVDVTATAKEAIKLLLPIYDFFYGVNEDNRYIQDMYGLPSKIYYTVVSLVYYGQAAWEIIYDDAGQPVSFDVLPGIVRPNINAKGKFLRPAYYFKPWNSQEIIEYRHPNDLLYVIWPGIDFSVWGSTEYDALADVSIPSDLYAGMAYRNHFENINSPYNGYWVVDKDTDDDDYKAFLQSLINRYSGIVNYGRNPIVIRGDAEFKETRSRSNDDAPYLDGRRYNQEELSAVTAVPSAKLGLADNSTKTNFREQRRDFHENTLRPIFEIIEDAIYRQIFVRGFRIKEWKLSFNSPDLTTAIEAATINTRYILNGVLSPNEVRQTLGYQDREDQLGDTFFAATTSLPADQAAIQAELATQAAAQATKEAPHPGDRDTEPEGGSSRQFDNVRAPTQDRAHTGNEALPASQRMVAIDLEKILSELHSWKNFAMRVASGKRVQREFTTDYIPANIADQIRKSLVFIGESSNKDNGELIEAMFDVISDMLGKEITQHNQDLTNLHKYGIGISNDR